MTISADTPLLFVHIPGAGGLERFPSVMEQYAGSVADLHGISAEGALQLARDTARVVYCGHFCFGYHDWVTRPAYYMTVVRNPIDRVLSCDAVSVRDNEMVRYLSGFGLRAAPCPPEALQQAKDNVAHCFSVVGIAEQYDATVDLMRRVFGWDWLTPAALSATRAVSRPVIAQVDAPERDRIARSNALDLALYDFIAERFEKQKHHAPAPVLIAGENRSDSPTMCISTRRLRFPRKNAEG